MKDHQKGIVELVGLLKERFGILITAKDAKELVAYAKAWADHATIQCEPNKNMVD